MIEYGLCLRFRVRASVSSEAVELLTRALSEVPWYEGRSASPRFGEGFSHDSSRFEDVPSGLSFDGVHALVAVGCVGLESDVGPTAAGTREETVLRLLAAMSDEPVGTVVGAVSHELQDGFCEGWAGTPVLACADGFRVVGNVRDSHASDGEPPDDADAVPVPPVVPAAAMRPDGRSRVSLDWAGLRTVRTLPPTAVGGAPTGPAPSPT